MELVAVVGESHEADEITIAHLGAPGTVLEEEVVVGVDVEGFVGELCAPSAVLDGAELCLAAKLRGTVAIVAFGGGAATAVGEEDYVEVSFGQFAELVCQFEGVSALDGERGD